jgi:hypothetical protein
MVEVATLRPDCMNTTWRTQWQQQDIVVYRDDVEVDRIPATRIEKVFLVYRGTGDSPGDIGVSVAQLDDGYALFEAETGFAGRVNFERHAFWEQRQCVFWVSAASATLPWRLRLGAWPGSAPGRAYRRLERSELDGCISHWKPEGPETWEARKKRRIDRSRPFGSGSSAAAPGQDRTRASRRG